MLPKRTYRKDQYTTPGVVYNGKACLGTGTGTYGWKNVSVIRPHDVSAWFDSWFKGVVYGGSAGVRETYTSGRYVLPMAYR